MQTFKEVESLYLFSGWPKTELASEGQGRSLRANSRASMLSLRTSFLVCAGIFVLIVGLAALGNFAHASGIRSDAWLSLTSKIVFIGLAVVLAFAFVPLMVNLVFGAQRAIGNEARLAPLFAARVAIIWILWTLMGLGAIVGVAGAVLSGAFGDLRGSLGGHMFSPSGGLLVAGIGMTIADLRHASTYDLGPEAGRYQTISDTGGRFDFQPAGTPSVFRGCDAFYIELDKTGRISQVHVSLVPDTIDGPALQRLLSDTQARLRRDGWTELDRSRFVRGHTMLALSKQRMDEWHEGDRADSGTWNAFADLYAVTK